MNSRLLERGNSPHTSVEIYPPELNGTRPIPAPPRVRLAGSERQAGDRLQLGDREPVQGEQLRHGGKENSRHVPYADFLDYGIARRNSIARAIREAEALGLLEVVRGGVGNRGRGMPNKYRLTYLPLDATDEWRKVETMEEARHRTAAVKNSREPSPCLRAGRAAKVVPLVS
jgi:hypothetical protein